MHNKGISLMERKSSTTQSKTTIRKIFELQSQAPITQILFQSKPLMIMVLIGFIVLIAFSAVLYNIATI